MKNGILLLIFLSIACTDRPSFQNMEMSLVQGGKFRSINNRDTIEINVKSFYVDKYEVRVCDFAEFVKVTGYVTDAEKDGGLSSILKNMTVTEKKNINWRYDEFGKLRPLQDYDYPVIHVSYNDANAYAAWAKKRLPSYYEWEYMANEGKDSPIAEFMVKNAWYDENSGLRIHKAKEKAANALGIYDLLGNILEYVQLKKDGTTETGGSKGGAFWMDVSLCRSEYTVLIGPKSRDFYCGFRCVSDSSR